MPNGERKINEEFSENQENNIFLIHFRETNNKIKCPELLC